MRRFRRTLGTLMIAAGVLTLGWAVLVWRWQDPFSALYTHVQQNRLASAYEERAQAYETHRIAGRDLAAIRRGSPSRRANIAGRCTPATRSGA